MQSLKGYLYKPYQAGTFKNGASGRITAFIKGSLAALFIKREIRLASEDVKANPTLCKPIAAPLAKIGDPVKAAFDKLKGGDAGGITDANSLISGIEGTSSKDGVAITENDNPDLGSTPNRRHRLATHTFPASRTAQQASAAAAAMEISTRDGVRDRPSP